MDGKDEDFTHRAIRTITAGTGKTARRVRIASHYEFATHTVLAQRQHLYRAGAPPASPRSAPK